MKGRIEAERNLEIAQLQGDSAYELIQFVLSDLRESLLEEMSVKKGFTIPESARVSHAVAGRVSVPVLDYFQSLDMTDWPDDLKRQNAFRMRESGALFSHMGRPEVSLALTTPSLEILTELSDEENESIATTINNIGFLLLDLGYFEDALDKFQESLRIRERLERGSVAHSNSLNNLGELHRTLGNLDEAEKLLFEALQIRMEHLGENDIHTVTSLNNMGLLCSDLARFAESEAYYNRALSGLAEYFGKNDILEKEAKSLRGTILNNLGSLQFTLGQYHLAESHFNELLNYTLELEGESHPNAALSFHNLAQAKMEVGQLEEAEELLNKALELRENIYGRDNLETAYTIEALGSLFRTREEYDRAEEFFIEALRIQEDILGVGHRTVLSTMNNLAMIYDMQDRFEESEIIYLTAIKRADEQLGEDDPLKYTLRGNLGFALMLMKRFEESEKYFLETVNFYKSYLGESNARTIIWQTNLTTMYLNEDNIEKAGPLIPVCSEKLESVFGLAHRRTGRFISKSAGFYRDRGMYGEALKWYHKLEEIRSLTHGADSGERASVSLMVGELHFRLGELERAEEYLSKSIDQLSIAMEENPENLFYKKRFASALLLKGLLEREKGSEQVAVECFQEVLEICSPFEGDVESLAMIDLAMRANLYAGNSEKAKELYNFLEAHDYEETFFKEDWEKFMD